MTKPPATATVATHLRIDGDVRALVDEFAALTGRKLSAAAEILFMDGLDAHRAEIERLREKAARAEQVRGGATR